ncbi:MAG: hypothetical protein OEW29_18090 [Acidimicrobiia bacterium]|nr:hypothetical protein [Acidimicrobiia bacterium]MDH4366395.1 hypothetical protein [Acidimicrobiia bacterium]
MILLWAWVASIVSLFCSLVVWVLRLLVRLVRAWLRRRHARHQPPPALLVQPPAPAPVSASSAREVWELERCVYWLLWALSRDVHPQAVTASARGTDPAWWATLARVRATIGHLSATAPDVELAAWCMHVVDLDQRSGARP